MESIALALSDSLLANKSSKYRAHGLFGIFARGAHFSVHGRDRHVSDYAGAKTQFLFRRVCELDARGARRRFSGVSLPLRRTSHAAENFSLRGDAASPVATLNRL